MRLIHYLHRERICELLWDIQAAWIFSWLCLRVCRDGWRWGGQHRVVKSRLDGWVRLLLRWRIVGGGFFLLGFRCDDRFVKRWAWLLVLNASSIVNTHIGACEGISTIEGIVTVCLDVVCAGNGLYLWASIAICCGGHDGLIKVCLRTEVIGLGIGWSYFWGVSSIDRRLPGIGIGVWLLLSQ